MITKLKKLSKHEIKILKKRFQTLVFNADFDLVCESHIPSTGIVLLGGEIKLFKKKKIQSRILPGCMLGIYELMNNQPTSNGCKVVGSSELILIQKSDVLEALNDKDSELYTIIKESIL